MKRDQVQVLGIVQEQHADRARLFMQWTGMDWPVLIDPFNELGVRAVPITVFIDEHGIVREIPQQVEDRGVVLEAFLDREYPAPEPSVPESPGGEEDDRADGRRAAAEQMRRIGLGMAKSETRVLTSVVDMLRRAAQEAPTEGASWFALGVAYRLRFESAERQPHDFRDAVAAWARALELDPNQYIWRRRLQQYGPRLEKPYPFFDWIYDARRAIRRRGLEPVKLAVEPGIAELARPLQAVEPPGNQRPPDGADRITRDDRGFVRIEQVTVPPAVAPGGTARVYLQMEPDEDGPAYWNNESTPPLIWIDPPEGWILDQRLAAGPQAKQPTSRELRTVEIEVFLPESATAGMHSMRAYALYNVCEGPDGTCLYRRKDFTVDIEVTSGE